MKIAFLFELYNMGVVKIFPLIGGKIQLAGSHLDNGSVVLGGPLGDTWSVAQHGRDNEQHTAIVKGAEHRYIRNFADRRFEWVLPADGKKITGFLGWRDYAIIHEPGAHGKERG